MISFFIHGQPPRKSNSRQIVTNRRTGKPMLIKSAEALAWVSSAPCRSWLGTGLT